MTGRKGRVVCREDGDVEYELRHAGADVPLELMNMDEKDKFMKGEKLIAVISEAASSGISLQVNFKTVFFIFVSFYVFLGLYIGKLKTSFGLHSCF